MSQVTIPKVYAAIAAVTAQLAKEGISKDRKNQQQGYVFRGIDDVYNALSPALSDNGLCMLPRILSRELVERQTQKGGALFSVTVEAEFDLVCAEDGSKHTIRTYGEAMDSADKATNKAMSAAYKYAAMQAFAIPTEGDNDADAVSHEVKAGATNAVQERRPKAKSREIDGEMRREIEACQSVEELQRLWRSKAFQDELVRHPKDWQDAIVAYFDEITQDLTKTPPRQPAGFVQPNFDHLGSPA